MIGSGIMAIENLSTNNEIQMMLQFLTPWKSTSKIIFEFSESESQTKVNWKMEGTLPFFMFPFKKMMQAMITRDFHRGLSMLKEHLDTGKVLSKPNLAMNQEMPEIYFVGIKQTCSISDIGPVDYTSI